MFQSEKDVSSELIAYIITRERSSKGLLFTRESMQCSRGSTFCFLLLLLLLLLLWRWMIYSIIANFVMDARRVVYCEFRHSCTSGSCVSRKIESRQFIKIHIDLRRVNIRVDLRHVALIRYAQPAV
jgi:hypothetical protein